MPLLELAYHSSYSVDYLLLYLRLSSPGQGSRTAAVWGELFAGHSCRRQSMTDLTQTLASIR